MLSQELSVILHLHTQLCNLKETHIRHTNIREAEAGEVQTQGHSRLYSGAPGLSQAPNNRKRKTNQQKELRATEMECLSKG